MEFVPWVLFLKLLPPRSPFVPSETLLIAFELNAGVEELLWKDELVLKFLSIAVKKQKHQDIKF